MGVSERLTNQEDVLHSRTLEEGPHLLREHSDTVEISIIVPVYNGVYHLERCVGTLHKYMAETSESYEILIAEDGSTDGTKELCERLRENYSEIRFAIYPHRLGRGLSIMRALEMSSGSVVLYTDVDLPVNLDHLLDLITAVRTGADIATGSRYMPGSVTHNTFLRGVMSRIYNLIVRIVFRSNIRDHQCGFKAFRKKALIDLSPQLKADHWFWDTELLIKAQMLDYRVSEIPVKWSFDDRGLSTVNPTRDAVYFFSEILRLKSDLQVLRKPNKS